MAAALVAAPYGDLRRSPAISPLSPLPLAGASLTGSGRRSAPNDTTGVTINPNREEHSAGAYSAPAGNGASLGSGYPVTCLAHSLSVRHLHVLIA
jgi:hypothetical protein